MMRCSQPALVAVAASASTPLGPRPHRQRPFSLRSRGVNPSERGMALSLPPLPWRPPGPPTDSACNNAAPITGLGPQPRGSTCPYMRASPLMHKYAPRRTTMQLPQGPTASLELPAAEPPLLSARAAHRCHPVAPSAEGVLPPAAPLCKLAHRRRAHDARSRRRHHRRPGLWLPQLVCATSPALLTRKRSQTWLQPVPAGHGWRIRPYPGRLEASCGSGSAVALP